MSESSSGDMNTKVRTFIATEIMLEDDPSVVNDETRLVGGVMDSLGLLQLVAYLEEEFGITFDETEFSPQNFRTVSSVERLLESKTRSH
jgi:acyl carrier protein